MRVLYEGARAALDVKAVRHKGEVMPETRREVFRKPVFSTLGLFGSASLLKAGEAQKCDGTTDVYSPILGTALVGGAPVPVFIVPYQGSLSICKIVAPPPLFGGKVSPYIDTVYWYTLYQSSGGLASFPSTSNSVTLVTSAGNASFPLANGIVGLSPGDEGNYCNLNWNEIGRCQKLR